MGTGRNFSRKESLYTYIGRRRWGSLYLGRAVRNTHRDVSKYKVISCFFYMYTQIFVNLFVFDVLCVFFYENVFQLPGFDCHV